MYNVYRKNVKPFFLKLYLRKEAFIFVGYTYIYRIDIFSEFKIYLFYMQNIFFRNSLFQVLKKIYNFF